MIKVANEVTDINPNVSIRDTEEVSKNVTSSRAIQYTKLVEAHETDIECLVTFKMTEGNMVMHIDPETQEIKEFVYGVLGLPV